MKERIRKLLEKSSKYLASRIIEEFLFFPLSLVVGYIFYHFLLPQASDTVGWLQTNGRVLQDAIQSGYLRETVFRNAEGKWAISVEFGGQPWIPFIHVIIYYAFLVTLLVGSLSCLTYVSYRYHKFSRFKKNCTYRRPSSNFRKTVSLGLVATLILISLVGSVGINTNPNAIIPAEPSNGLPPIEIHITDTVTISVQVGAIVKADPPVIEKNNITGQFCVIIESPSLSWNSSDIIESTILLNNETHPHSTFVKTESNGTVLMLAQFNEESLKNIIQDAVSVNLGNVTISVSGELRNGYSFAGNTQLGIEA